MVRIENVTRGTDLAANALLGLTYWLKLRGLQFRADFGPGWDGLWLAPTSEIHMFCCRFPIDLVWLDASLRVIGLVEGIKPWRLARCGGAHSVIELPAGRIAASRSAVGDALRFTQPLEPSTGV